MDFHKIKGYIGILNICFTVAGIYLVLYLILSGNHIFMQSWIFYFLIGNTIFSFFIMLFSNDLFWELIDKLNKNKDKHK